MTNHGPATATGVALRVPPSTGLTKQVAICSGTGATCPSGLTAGALETGISLPTIPAGGTIRISFFAWVTGQVGGNVSVTAAVPVAATPDPNAANNSSTLSQTIEPSTTLDPSMALMTRIEADPRSATYWQPNATARYIATIGLAGIPDRSPTTTADGALFAVPAAENLSKTSVTCTASGGAQCPATVTVAQLESGVTIPRLPDFGTVTFAFSGTVTGPLGGTVTVRSVAAPPVGHTTPDSSLLNSSKTLSILVPSGSSGNNSGDAIAKLPASADATLSGLVSTSCQLAGPVIGTPTVTPTSVSFSWPHINGASYHVSRNGDIVTPNPMTSAVYPSTLSFSQSAPFYHHTTYVYAVTAQDENGGCGTTQISFAGVRPWVPVATATVASGTSPRSVTVGWRMPDELFPCSQSGPFTFCPRGPGADNVGFVVMGPGLPVSGYEIWGCPRAPYIPRYLDDPPVNYPPFTTKAPFKEECDGSNPRPEWAITVPVPAGNHTWTVVPYWDTANGRMADVSSGARVTINVP